MSAAEPALKELEMLIKEVPKSNSSKVMFATGLFILSVTLMTIFLFPQ
jgi:hypothetical protein